MVKLKAPVKTVSKVRTSVRVPTGMINRITGDMQKSGFNKKQQSKWINIALLELLDMPNYTDLIAEEFISAGTTISLNISIPSETEKKVQEAITAVSSSEKMAKDKSAVIRVAIIQKLLRSEGRSLRIDI